MQSDVEFKRSNLVIAKFFLLQSLLYLVLVSTSKGTRLRPVHFQHPLQIPNPLVKSKPYAKPKPTAKPKPDANSHLTAKPKPAANSQPDAKSKFSPKSYPIATLKSDLTCAFKSGVLYNFSLMKFSH